MVMQIFTPLESDTDTFSGNKIGEIAHVLSYDYLKKWNEPGSFTVTFSLDEPDADKVQPDKLLYYDGDMLIVRDVSYDGQKYTVKGTDLKAYAAQRITLYGDPQEPGTEGYDVCGGTTEHIAKYYVNRNMVNPADPYRRIPGMTIASDQSRGIAIDTYMARLEQLDSVLHKLCDNAQCGYDIVPDFANNHLVFDFMAPIEKTETNITRDRVVFSKGYGNVLSIARDQTTDDYRNVFYATKSTGTMEADALTKLVLRDGATTPGGAYRREINVTVNPDSVEDIDLYARHEAENYVQTDSFSVDAKAAEEYGTVYTIGDTVTIRDTERGYSEDKIITEAHKEYSNGQHKIGLTMGYKRSKPLNAINEKAESSNYSIKNILTDKASAEEVREKVSSTKGLSEQLYELMANSMGLYLTTEAAENGGMIYYMHNAPTMEESGIIWKRTAEAWAVSTDGGQTWNGGFTAEANLIANVIKANEIESNKVVEHGTASYGSTSFAYDLLITAALISITSGGSDRVKIEDVAVEYIGETQSIKDRGQITLVEDGMQSVMCSRYAYFGRKDSDGSFIGGISTGDIDANTINGKTLSWTYDQSIGKYVLTGG